MYFDRFDVCAAYYLFFTHYHEGQGSEKYARLCKLVSYYRTSFTLRQGVLNENAQAIYDNLVEQGNV